jgi:hypothetical protein
MIVILILCDAVMLRDYHHTVARSHIVPGIFVNIA